MSHDQNAPQVPKAAQERFSAWLKEAEEKEINDPNAMTLASVSASGMPSARTVLMKGFDARGWVFYTNLTSRKGQEILASGKASILFHWKTLLRQVRVDGLVSKVSDEEADAYFATRSRGSQIGAWASDQSSPMAGRSDLEDRLADTASRFEDRDVPRPPHWSGLRLSPLYVEFWTDQKNRLHVRETLTYDQESATWREGMLFP